MLNLLRNTYHLFVDPQAWRLRLRPIVRFCYRIYARAYTVWQRIALTNPQVWRLWLRPIVRFFYRVYTRFYAVKYWLWNLAHRYRPLLALDRRHLSRVEWLQRGAMEALFALLDYRYKYKFARLRAPATFTTDLDTARMVLMIGSLGPGGAERQATLTLCGLKQLGFEDIELIAINLQSDFQRFHLPKLEAQGIAATELLRLTEAQPCADAMTALAVAKRLPAELGDVRDYIVTMASRRPGVVHLWLDEVIIKGGIAAVLLGIPRIIVSMRSLPPCHFILHQPYMREAYRWLARQPGVVMCNNSQAGAQAYEQWLGLPSGSIKTVHNGFDFDTPQLHSYRSQRLEYRQRHHIPAHVPLVGTVIRLSEEKRPLLWAEIAARIAVLAPEAQFLVVGDGPLRTELMARGEQAGLSGRFHVVGHEREALAAIAAMDVFLLTSRVEGLPNVLIEAQALGVPVVSTNVGGAGETLQHRVTGWLLESDEPDYASMVIARLLKDEHWLQQAKVASCQFVQQHFSQHRMLAETRALYAGSPPVHDTVEAVTIRMEDEQQRTTLRVW